MEEKEAAEAADKAKAALAAAEAAKERADTQAGALEKAEADAGGCRTAHFGGERSMMVVVVGARQRAALSRLDACYFEPPSFSLSLSLSFSLPPNDALMLCSLVAPAAAEHQAAADALREKADSERDAAVQRGLAEKAADDALAAQRAAENRSKVRPDPGAAGRACRPLESWGTEPLR